MNVIYTARHLEISDDMKAEIHKRLLKKVKFYFEQIIKVEVIMEMQKELFTVEIKTAASHDSFFAKDSKKDWLSAVEECLDKMEKEIKKKRDKVTDHHRVKKPIEEV